MPPWCSYYGSTVNADPLVLLNRPTSAVSGPLTGPAISGSFTGPAISGPFTGPAPSETPAQAGSALFAGQASLDRRALNLSEASKLLKSLMFSLICDRAIL